MEGKHFQSQGIHQRQRKMILHHLCSCLPLDPACPRRSPQKGLLQNRKQHWRGQYYWMVLYLIIRNSFFFFLCSFWSKFCLLLDLKTILHIKSSWFPYFACSALKTSEPNSKYCIKAPNFPAYFYSRFIVDHHDLKSNFQIGCINYWNLKTAARDWWLIIPKRSKCLI